MMVDFQHPSDDDILHSKIGLLYINYSLFYGTVPGHTTI